MAPLSSRSSLFALWALVLVVTASISRVMADETCSSGEETLEFRFFTDSQSWLENGWSLECTDADSGLAETIWQVPAGSLERRNTTEVIRYADCIPKTFTCTFTLVDFGGDGLTAQYDDGFTGWFALVYGATTIATYNGTEHFSQKTYCIGVDCEKLPQEITNNGQCMDLTLYMRLDGRPQDTAYSLVCDDVVVWEGKDFVTAGEELDKDTCIAATSCCTFTVTDTDTEGMTTPVLGSDGSEQYGQVFLDWDSQGLLEYDGVTGEEFQTLSVDFGSGCSQGTAAPGTTGDGGVTVADQSGNDNGEEITVPAGGTQGGNSGGSAIVETSSNQLSGDGLSDGAMIAMISVAGLVLFAGLVGALLYSKTTRSVQLTKDEAVL